MNNLKRYLCILPGVAMLSLTPAFAQQPGESILQHMGLRDVGVDTFYLTEQGQKRVVDYNSDRIVRICTERSDMVTALTVTYDEREAVVLPGDCLRVEAKRVAIQPAEELEPNAMMRVEVDTISVQ